MNRLNLPSRNLLGRYDWPVAFVVGFLLLIWKFAVGVHDPMPISWMLIWIFASGSVSGLLLYLSAARFSVLVFLCLPVTGWNFFWFVIRATHPVAPLSFPLELIHFLLAVGAGAYVIRHFFQRKAIQER
jgi:hypothetical protein